MKLITKLLMVAVMMTTSFGVLAQPTLKGVKKKLNKGVVKVPKGTDDKKPETSSISGSGKWDKYPDLSIPETGGTIRRYYIRLVDAGNEGDALVSKELTKEEEGYSNSGAARPTKGTKTKSGTKSSSGSDAKWEQLKYDRYSSYANTSIKGLKRHVELCKSKDVDGKYNWDVYTKMISKLRSSYDQRLTTMKGESDQKLIAETNSQVTNELSQEESAELKRMIDYVLKVSNDSQMPEISNANAYKNWSELGSPEDFEKLFTSFREYTEQGKTADPLTNYRGYVLEKLPKLIAENYPSQVKTRFDRAKEATKAAKHPVNATTHQQEAALKEWKVFEGMMNVYLGADPGNSEYASYLSYSIKEGKFIDDKLMSTYSKYLGNDFHKQHRGELLIAHQAIDYNKTSQTNFCGEKIVIDENTASLHFLLLANTPLKDLLDRSTMVGAVIRFNDQVGIEWEGCGGTHNARQYDISNAEEANSYLSLPLFPSVEEYSRNKWFDDTYWLFAGCVMGLMPGETHKMEVEIFFTGHRDKSFKKTYDLEITESGIKKLVELRKAIAEAEVEAARMPKSGSLHSQYVNLATSGAKNLGYNVQAVSVIKEQFELFTDAYNRPVNKQLHRGVCIAWKNNQGQCFYSNAFSIDIKNTGGNSWGKPVFIGPKYSEDGKGADLIKCKNINK